MRMFILKLIQIILSSVWQKKPISHLIYLTCHPSRHMHLIYCPDTHSIAQSLTHSLTHSLIHYSLTYSLITHSLTHSLIHYSLTYSLITHSLTHLLTHYSLTHSLITHSLTHPLLTHSFTTHSLTHLLTHSLLIHSTCFQLVNACPLLWNVCPFFVLSVSLSLLNQSSLQGKRKLPTCQWSCLLLGARACLCLYKSELRQILLLKYQQFHYVIVKFKLT